MAVAKGAVSITVVKWLFDDITAAAASDFGKVLPAKAYSEINDVRQNYRNTHCAKRWAAKQTYSLFEELIIESPRLCQGMVTFVGSLCQPALAELPI